MWRTRSKLVFLACALAFAAGAPDAVNVAVNVARLRSDLNYLCSPKLEGRLSLSPGANAAAQYIASQFRKAGLAPPAGGKYLQEFPLVAYEPDRERTGLVLVRKGERTAFHYGQDFRGGYWRELSLTAPVVFAGYGITAPEYGYDDYAGIDVRGKIVLVFDHEPQETDPGSIFNGTGHTRHGVSRVKMENARRHGAVAILIANEPLRKHAGVFDATPRATGERSLRATAPRQTNEEDAIPVIQVSDGTAAELLKAAGRTSAEIAQAIDRDTRPASKPLPDTGIELKTAPANLHRARSSNVVGLLEGTDPDLRSQTIMLTAHYDHLGVVNGRLYPGANDNASGTVGVMELARMFAHSKRPRRSLLFVVFGSEEELMLGSYYYVAHPLRPLETTRAVLNLDMIARDEAHIPQSQGVLDIPADTTNEINLIGTFYSPDLLAAIQNANGKTHLELSTKFDRDHDLNALFRCDHLPFLLRDVPAVWLFGGWHPGYHEPADTVENLNFAKLEKVISLAYWTADALAGTEQPPRFSTALR